jgi:hypothetical protein
LKALQDNQITGKDVAPFLLGYFREPTHGVGLQTNIDLVLNKCHARRRDRCSAAGGHERIVTIGVTEIN